jgi:hypothetical protein
MSENNMRDVRLGRVLSWVAVAVSGLVAAVYFIDPTRRAAITQTAGWFLTAARFIQSGQG